MQHFIHEILPELPLFQGLGKIDLQEFAMSVPHRMATYREGEVLVSQGDACKQLMVVYKGTVMLHTYSSNKRYAFEERLQAPIVLQAASLYGIAPYSMHTISAQTEVQAIIIPKESVTFLTETYEVFRIHLINLLSTQIFRARKWVWNEMDENLERRIVNFFLKRSSYPAGEKILHISMEELGKQMNETRSNVSQALNEMERKNLVVLKRKTVIVPNLEKLQQQT